jgi:hypothetical protein
MNYSFCCLLMTDIEELREIFDDLVGDIKKR